MSHAPVRFRLDARHKGARWYRQKTYQVDQFELACRVVDQLAHRPDTDARLIAMPADLLVHSTDSAGCWAVV